MGFSIDMLMLVDRETNGVFFGLTRNKYGHLRIHHIYSLLHKDSSFTTLVPKLIGELRNDENVRWPLNLAIRVLPMPLDCSVLFGR